MPTLILYKLYFSSYYCPYWGVKLDRKPSDSATLYFITINDHSQTLNFRCQWILLQKRIVASYSIRDVLYWQHNIATQRDYAMRTCALFENITS